MRYFPLLFLLGITGCIPRTEPLACGWPGDEWRSRVVNIVGEDSARASGTLIGGSTVLTAAHVVYSGGDHGFSIDGITHTMRDIRAGAANPMESGENPNRDWLLASTDLTMEPAPILPDALVTGEQVWVIGFPMVFPQIVTTGRYWGDYEGIAWTTAPVTSGVSGGAMLACRDGKHVLAGVLSVVASSPIMQTFRGTIREEINFMSGAVHVRDIPL